MRALSFGRSSGTSAARPRRTCLRWVLVPVILFGPPGVPSALAQAQHIVLRFDPAPLAAPAVYKSFTRPVAGDAAAKAVAYQSRVRSLSGGGTNGVFSADSTGSDSQEALRGQTVAPDLVFGKFFRPSLAGNGDVVWTSRLWRFGYGVFRTGPALSESFV